VDPKLRLHTSPYFCDSLSNVFLKSPRLRNGKEPTIGRTGGPGGRFNEGFVLINHVVSNSEPISVNHDVRLSDDSNGIIFTTSILVTDLK
jgi:hypothetical protein